MKCTLQRPLSKSFGQNALCSAFSQKFSTRCILQSVLSKVLVALHFAEPSLKKFGAAALLQQLRHKNSGGNAPCSTLPQGGLAMHGYAGAICKMVCLRKCAYLCSGYLAYMQKLFTII